MDNQLAVYEKAGMPALTIQDAVARYNAVVEFTKTVMKRDKDFGVIPGTDKPTLLKPGAEKLCSLFGLTPKFVIVDRIVDFQAGMFYYQYCCELWHGDRLVATGNGSCNSMEKKYRWRNVTEKKATEADKLNGRREMRSGKFGDYWVYVVENMDPADLVNTIDKMAQKRSLVAATLIAANASEFFTQDMEDIVIEAEWSETQEQQPKQNGHKPEPELSPLEAAKRTPTKAGGKLLGELTQEQLLQVIEITKVASMKAAANLVLDDLLDNQPPSEA